MSEPKEKGIIAFVMQLPKTSVESVRALEQDLGEEFDILLITDSRINPKSLEPTGSADIHVECDFSKPLQIVQSLQPYQDRLRAITCRGEAYIPRFQTLIPNVPYLRTPTTESLRWASDKYEMRKRLRSYSKKLTPQFTIVEKNSKAERAHVIEKVGFPMIVKPTNLAASRFVTICYHEEELERALRNIFRRIRTAYKGDDRLEEPKIIAEEFMEGSMYSIDSYVDSRGTVSHCPLVQVKTGRDIGHDDFYNYLQMTPAAFKRTTVARAEETATAAIHALGLRSTIAHIELMKIDDEWKVIEVGARMGGFRHVLYKLSCGIDHAQNDIRIRLPKKPIVPKKCQGFACVIKWFAGKEGTISEMRGIKKLEELESFHQIHVNKKVGDRAVFARNGGRSIFNVFLYNADRSKLLADIRRLEQMVDIKVNGRRSGRSGESAKKG